MTTKLEALMREYGRGDPLLRAIEAEYQQLLDSMHAAAARLADLGEQRWSAGLETWARGLESHACRHIHAIVRRDPLER